MFCISILSNLFLFIFKEGLNILLYSNFIYVFINYVVNKYLLVIILILV